MSKKDIDENDFNKNDFLRALSKQITKIRKSKGYSQDRLTLESGLARGTVSKVERGTDPRASTLARIARTLGVPMAKLVEVKLD